MDLVIPLKLRVELAEVRALVVNLFLVFPGDHLITCSWHWSLIIADGIVPVGYLQLCRSFEPSLIFKMECYCKVAGSSTHCVGNGMTISVFANF